jgi:hypothetical protein
LNQDGLTIDPQRDISISLLNNLLQLNQEGILLMSRIFPKSLFKRMNPKKKLFKTFSWSYDEWHEFFHLLRMNYNTSKE